MTQEEKDILLEKMLDPDGVLTDTELEMVFLDDELKDIYEVSSAVRGASVQPYAIDVKKEWRLFRHRIHPKPSRWRWTMRAAAIFIGVLLVSSVLKITIDRLLSDDKPAITVDSKKPEVRKHPKDTPSPTPAPTVEDTGFPVLQAASAKKVNTAKRNAPPKRGEGEEEIDVDEYLRLQQARIDNELALMQAELYIAELQALDEIKNPVEGEKAPEQNEVRYVIMQ